MATQDPVNLLDIQILLEEEHTADVAPHSTSVLPSAEEDDQTKLNRQSSTVLSIRSMLKSSTPLDLYAPQALSKVTTHCQLWLFQNKNAITPS